MLKQPLNQIKSFKNDGSDISTALNSIVKDQLSPTEEERRKISEIYQDLQNCLIGHSFQSGSYARFTSITPVNDLDIIWIIPPDEQEEFIYKDHDVRQAFDFLTKMASDLENKLNKKGYSVRTQVQTHSIGIEFINDKSDFTIDVVPAREINAKNKFHQNLYEVPEIAKFNHEHRRKFYATKESENKLGEITWIKTDPKGYIELAKLVNQKNNDFRHSVKFLKGWRTIHKEILGEFKLKSFHIECVIRDYFCEDKVKTTNQAIKLFLSQLSQILSQPSIKDLADGSRFIDDYVKSLSEEEKNKIISAANEFLLFLDELEYCTDSNLTIDKLNQFTGQLKLPRESDEEHITDLGFVILPMINFNLDITGKVLGKDGFHSYYLKDKNNEVNKNRKIQFSKQALSPQIYDTADKNLYWKVKNKGVEANQLRGEITKNQTRNDPEHTQYIGSHYVECFVTKNFFCYGSKKIEVKII